MEISSMIYNVDVLRLLGFSKQQISNIKETMYCIPQPNYAAFDFPTKISPRMSDSEYEEAIREQAIKDFESGAGIMKSTDTRNLQKEYVSVISPDRRGIINSAMRAIKQSAKKGNTGYATFGTFKDLSGTVVANYSSNSGWFAMGTNDEFERDARFWAIYRETYMKLEAQVKTSKAASVSLLGQKFFAEV
jgi:hypothetical protein